MLAVATPTGEAWAVTPEKCWADCEALGKDVRACTLMCGPKPRSIRGPTTMQKVMMVVVVVEGVPDQQELLSSRRPQPVQCRNNRMSVRENDVLQCMSFKLAQSGHDEGARRCLLSEAKRTFS